MTRIYIVMDTNVVVSALLKRDSKPNSIVQLCLSGVIASLYNEEILYEYREVLSRDKFNFDALDVEKTINGIIANGINVDAEHIDIELPDEKDRVFYEVVMEASKDKRSYLVTGNIKHFPNEPRIVTSSELLEILIRELTNS